MAKLHRKPPREKYVQKQSSKIVKNVLQPINTPVGRLGWYQLWLWLLLRM